MVRNMRFWTPRLREDGWIDDDSLKEMFKSVGRDVKVSPKATFYGSENIEIGDNVRIDDGNLFLCAKGSLKIGNHVHLAANSIYSCGGGIDIGDHVQIGFNVKLVSASDDVCGEKLIGPTYPELFRDVDMNPIFLRRLSVVLMGSCLLPGTILKEGAMILPLSSTRNYTEYEAWEAFGGVPCEFVFKRKLTAKDLAVDWEEQYAASKINSGRQ